MVKIEGLSMYLTLILLFFTGCEYRHDRLLIENGTATGICVETLVKRKGEHQFSPVSAGGYVKPFSHISAIRRGEAIAEIVNLKTIDKKLYVVFYRLNDVEYVHKNIASIVADRRVTVRCFTAGELDSLKWKISFRDSLP